MINSYDDMRLHHLLEIQALKDLQASDAVKELMIVSILSGIDPDELKAMPASEYDALRQQTAFLQQTPPDDIKIYEEIEINGTVYTICKNMESVSTGQYIDWLTYTQGIKQLTDLYSVMCVPKGHKYGDGYSLDKVKADMADLPLAVTRFISAFWMTSLVLFSQRSARVLEKEVKKLRKMKEIPKEKVKEMETLAKNLRSQLATGGIVLPRSASISA